MENIIKDVIKKYYEMLNDRNILFLGNAIQYYPKYAVIQTALLTNIDTKLLELMVYNICNISETNFGKKINYYFLWNYDIMFLEERNMKHNFNIKIPYGYRENYADAVYEINQVVEKDGVVILFVNNNPYCLDCILYIESQYHEEIISIINKYQLEQLHYGKYLREYIEQMKDKSWNAFSLLEEEPYFKSRYLHMFQVPSIQELKKEGYDFPVDKRKIFVSYSHKDSNVVLPFVEQLKNFGLSLWIDEIELDFGENITDKIQRAMKNCEKALLFLSENTKNAFYAKHELITLFNDAIKNEKKIIPIKIDECDLNDIIYGLNNYKYVEYSNKSNLEKLISRLIFEYRGR